MTEVTQPATDTIMIEAITFPIRATPLAKLVGARAIFAQGMDTEASVDALSEALYHGIRRAGGDIKLEWLKENIDFHNQDAVFAKFIEVNGLKPKADGSGEAPAGQTS
ncbi:MAG: hypothetical protein ABI859_08195 [Pseudomonadota bacterium]